MSNPTFDARDLWRTQVPYVEHDKLEPVIVTSVRTLIFAARWRAASALVLSGFSLSTDTELTGASGLRADGLVV